MLFLNWFPDIEEIWENLWDGRLQTRAPASSRVSYEANEGLTSCGPLCLGGVLRQQWSLELEKLGIRSRLSCMQSRCSTTSLWSLLKPLVCQDFPVNKCHVLCSLKHSGSWAFSPIYRSWYFNKAFLTLLFLHWELQKLFLNELQKQRWKNRKASDPAWCVCVLREGGNYGKTHRSHLALQETGEAWKAYRAK